MQAITKFRDLNQLKSVLAKEYQRQIENFFGDPQKALEFLTNVGISIQRNPKLLECVPATVMNSFMTMAALKLMPSGVSGEAFVIPYEKKGVLEAQFQLGYQGIITLLYRAGNKEVVAELVREKDEFKLSRGKITHEIDPRKTKDERGDWIGAYAIITTALGGSVEAYMTRKDILAHAKKFSKSFSSAHSPWNEASDPEGWMPRKTVLKQCAKLAPKNEALNTAIAEDNKDSILADRLDTAKKESEGLAMGNLLNDGKDTKGAEAADGVDSSEGAQGEAPEEAPTIH